MVLSPGRLFGIAKLTEVLDMVTGERLYRFEGRHNHDRNSFFHKLCRDAPHRRTRRVRERVPHPLRPRQRRPLLPARTDGQSDAEWLANNMNSATKSETVWQVTRKRVRCTHAASCSRPGVYRSVYRFH